MVANHSKAVAVSSPVFGSCFSAFVVFTLEVLLSLIGESVASPDLVSTLVPTGFESAEVSVCNGYSGRATIGGRSVPNEC